MIERSRLALNDLISESVTGILQRPGRSVLTMLGTVLGIGSFVAVLGLTTTAQGQIDSRFSALAATEVIVEDIGADDVRHETSFPTDASARVRRVEGVVAAGVFWALPVRNPVVTGAPNLPGDGTGIALFGADPGALAAMRPVMQAGRLYDEFHQGRAERVALLGAGAARKLGIGRLDAHPAVFINGLPYTIIGIIFDLARQPELLLGVVLPSATALKAYGPPVTPPAKMLIETRLGAAKVVADQVPLALRADAPERFQVVPPPDPQALRGNVANDLNALFLLLAAVSLVIGAVGIANTTFVAVLERTSEIGLRRALGARAHHIAAQFLAESAALGAFGGLVGASTGTILVVTVAVLKEWTAVLSPVIVLPAPLVGCLVGVLAGLYPALRAAQVEPIDALRR
jgi:putative ABC transport system permease protein